ncbi:pentapeptide repeat-containing protein [Clostridium estertheticum]|uniref:pentapeptide repeat-containing protein n=1 Tax=Clostridium estertheticum TaxID=238834 RepID=UPI001C0CD301|nr:pentapeptide repeat-containing protein [Clostridium estertheticum]MBU3215193.1 pentapeptide repeat-containing protein [Clostridium estertheticum]WAG55520.1 pentapeptide repeat-containing protein [Clostridium estertheticum]
MNREESIKDFKEHFVKGLMEEYKTEFQENLDNNQEKLRGLLIEGMIDINDKAKKYQGKNENYKLAVLQFELLRINILNESYKILIHGYSSLWYLDKNSIYQEIDLKFLFEPFIKFKGKLIQAKNIYMGKVNFYDIQEIIFELVVECYNSMSELARIWLWNLDEEVWVKNGSFSDMYTVKWSEYQGQSETIFAMDNREKIMKDLLELKKVSEEKLPLVYSVWSNSNLENGDLTKQNMLFINFKASKLNNIDFSESNITTAQFKDTNIKKCEFKRSKLIGTSFEYAKIEGCNFENADLRAVDFRKSILKDITFKNVDLRGSDFTGAIFNNVSFEDASVEEVVFSEQDVPFLYLTPEQLQTIYITGGIEE